MPIILNISLDLNYRDDVLNAIEVMQRCIAAPKSTIITPEVNADLITAGSVVVTTSEDTKVVAGVLPESPAPAKRTRGPNKPKAVDAPQATSAVVEQSAPTPPVAVEVEAPKEAPAIIVPSLEDVRAAILALLNAKGQPKAQEVLSAFKATNASSVPVDKRVEVIAALKKAAE